MALALLIRRGSGIYLYMTSMDIIDKWSKFEVLQITSSWDFSESKFCAEYKNQNGNRGQIFIFMCLLRHFRVKFEQKSGKNGQNF